MATEGADSCGGRVPRGYAVFHRGADSCRGGRCHCISYTSCGPEKAASTTPA
eukprot:XP_001691208.1 predicted protein [Chlamydomonas reinhardtii]